MTRYRAYGGLRPWVGRHLDAIWGGLLLFAAVALVLLFAKL